MSAATLARAGREALAAQQAGGDLRDACAMLLAAMPCPASLFRRHDDGGEEHLAGSLDDALDHPGTEASPRQVLAFPVTALNGLVIGRLVVAANGTGAPGRAARAAGAQAAELAALIIEQPGQLEAQRLLEGELSHRIKNIFAIVGGLAQLASRRHPEARGFAAAYQARLAALSRAHEYVRPHSAQRQPKARTVRGLLEELLAPYTDEERSAIVMAGDDAEVGASGGTALALVIHELATNAAKYGALAASDGRVAIETARRDARFILVWAERGVTGAAAPARVGFGTELATRTVAGQLGGRIAQDWTTQGLTATIDLDLARLGV